MVGAILAARKDLVLWQSAQAVAKASAVPSSSLKLQDTDANRKNINTERPPMSSGLNPKNRHASEKFTPVQLTHWTIFSWAVSVWSPCFFEKITVY